ncbi:MAG: Scr1 family TA system antitoxin-like transcriptional regulator [Pseudonocardiaceae bacterium]
MSWCAVSVLVERRIQARMHRQSRLTAPDPLVLSVVVSEAALPHARDG